MLFNLLFLATITSGAVVQNRDYEWFNEDGLGVSTEHPINGEILDSTFVMDRDGEGNDNESTTEDNYDYGTEEYVVMDREGEGNDNESTTEENYDYGTEEYVEMDRDGEGNDNEPTTEENYDYGTEEYVVMDRDGEGNDNESTAEENFDYGTDESVDGWDVMFTDEPAGDRDYQPY